jgi:hypothetical protein
MSNEERNLTKKITMKTHYLTLTFVFLLFLSSQNSYAKNDSTAIATPEGIGQYLSALLINREDIKESPIAINVEQLLPDEDFSKYENSPAELILSLLLGQQLLLPQSWDELLFQADSLHFDENTSYLKTYFSQTNRDLFKATAILESMSKYYALTFTIIEWNDNRYVMSIDNQLKEYSSIDKLKEDCFFVEKSFEMDENNDLSEHYADDSNKKAYHYNQYSAIEITETVIPSYNFFLDKLTSSIKQSKDYNELSIFVTLPDTIESEYHEELRKLWNDLLLSIQEKKGTDLSIRTVLLNNVFLDDTDMYNAIIEYKLKSENNTYIFSCHSILVEDKWELINISLIEEEQPIFMF